MMKYLSLITLALFAAGLTGCSMHSRAASTRPAIDLVKAGKDVAFPEGYILHVAKREGNSLEGIRIRVTSPDGQTKEITADQGTIQPGVALRPGFPEYNAANQITITLHNAKTVSGTTNSTCAWEVIVLHS